MEQTKERLRTFLSQFFRHHDLQDDTNIFSLGFVNSLLAMQLVMFVEKEFAITIESEDLDFENFSSINAIDSLIQKKTGTPSPSYA